MFCFYEIQLKLYLNTTLVQQDTYFQYCLINSWWAKLLYFIFNQHSYFKIIHTDFFEISMTLIFILTCPLIHIQSTFSRTEISFKAIFLRTRYYKYHAPSYISSKRRTSEIKEKTTSNSNIYISEIGRL